MRKKKINERKSKKGYTHGNGMRMSGQKEGRREGPLVKKRIYTVHK